MDKNPRIRECQNPKCQAEYELCHVCEDFIKIAFSFRQVACSELCYLEILKIAMGESTTAVTEEDLEGISNPSIKVKATKSKE